MIGSSIYNVNEQRLEIRFRSGQEFGFETESTNERKLIKKARVTVVWPTIETRLVSFRPRKRNNRG